MARRRPTEATSSGIRAWVAADARATHEDLGQLRLVSDPDAPGQSKVVRMDGPSRWSQRADDLDAGEAVVIPGWELTRFLEGPYPGMVPAFRLEVDGSVTPMRRVRHGDTVDYEPDDGPQRWRPAAEPRWGSTRGST